MKSVLFLGFTFINIYSLLAAPEVQLPNGIIRGYDGTTITNKYFAGFEKIPYASPPVGDLRFKAPIPPSNWDEPLETTHLDKSCYQVDTDGDNEDEDCLYINVFTPQLPSDGTELLPVMVFIHGGGFRGGSSINSYADRLIDKDIIYVCMNYRLGPFGFLSTGDELIPGNNGLKDQHLSLKWVHDNIQLFGGDPDKITIFGESAGSASVAYHLLNQQSNGLFRAAILESGSFLNPWTFQRNPQDVAFGAAAILNPDFETNRNTQDLVNYLMGVEARDLDKMSIEYRDAHNTLPETQILQGFFWGPVIEPKNEDAFLTNKMYGLLQAGNVVKVPIMIGIMSEEGLAYNQNSDATHNNMVSFDQNLHWLVPHDMKITDEDQLGDVGSKIRDIYTEGAPLGDNLGAGVRYYTDNSFARGVIKHAELHSKVETTFFFQFSYVGDMSHQNTYYDGADKAGHGQELPYLFCGGTGCDVSGRPETDQLTTQRMVELWTNFAKYLNATPEATELLQNIIWPEVSTDGGDFLYLNIDENLEIRNHPKEATYDKWMDLYSSLGYDDFDTM